MTCKASLTSGAMGSRESANSYTSLAMPRQLNAIAVAGIIVLVSEAVVMWWPGQTRIISHQRNRSIVLCSATNWESAGRIFSFEMLYRTLVKML
jgi:hypothetical protein